MTDFRQVLEDNQLLQSFELFSNINDILEDNSIWINTLAVLVALIMLIFSIYLLTKDK